jgi:predicted nucleotidyltransferase
MTKLEKKEIQTTISAIVNRLVSSFDVEKIVLFGSYVTGKQMTTPWCQVL